MKSKINSTTLGLIIGLLVPLLVILLVYVIRFQSNMSLQTFIDSMLVHRIYTKVIALGVYFGNIVFFFIFIKTDLLKAAKGVLLATILYSLAIMVFRFGM
ncbi:hypothetical protein [Labilibaculum antarcticum]|uniref:Uncharacterized protein n=1 Tax=Labilibaculum antarcticum TaxID=1717717 RepID=A0A1Y1CP41_9BACT|nr:hypothetical protein [Labilibaculum antarcticum]BAX81021.1 hypothetical protein ALGA_2708 [Labilibaculum antarcticum]